MPTAPTARRRVPALGSALNFLNLSVVIPTLFSIVANYGFYPTGRFSPESFEATYGQGIWKYRVLGREAVLGLDRALANFLPETTGLRTHTLYASLSDYSPRFFFALFLFNTFFLVVTATLLHMALGTNWKSRSMSPRALLGVTMVAVIALSGFKVTPYDTISYACLCAAALIAGTQWSLSGKRMLACLFIIAVGTASRESMALFLAFRLALALAEDDWRSILAKPEWLTFRLQFAAMVMTFVAIYVGLRVLNNGSDIISRWTVDGLWRPATLIGIAWAISVGAVVARVTWAPRFVALFLLCSAPYFATIVLAADLYEIRLYVPVLLLIVIGSHFSTRTTAG